MDDKKSMNNKPTDIVEPVDDIKPDLEKLRIYSQAKMKLASQLRIVREAFTPLGIIDGERQFGELVVKLAEDHFTLAVLGQFKRGKSSLMNAIIGRELLPTGVLPLTSAITTLKYGPEERLIIRQEGYSFTKEEPVSSLADYVTERGNPSNQKKVQSACIELPVPFLRRGIEFVDTPGVGSAITANTEITYGFLPQCDAVIFVTGADTPMTSTELSFLKEIRGYVDKIFFAINKMDLIDENERNEVLQFVTNTITSQTGRSGVRIFPLSARLGLDARLNGDPALYEQSGLKTLEEALSTFLSEEKSAVFLTSIANKALKILDQEMERGAFDETALQERARVIQSKEYVMLKRDPHEAAAAVMDAKAKIQALYEQIVAGQMDAAAKAVDLPAAKNEQQSIQEPSPAALPLETEQLKTRGCPVCRRMTEYAQSFFATWQYQISSEERAQSRFASELGFCPLHTWQFLSMCSPHGASVGFAQLSEQISHQLKEAASSHADGKAVRRLVRNSHNCRVCDSLRQVEEESISHLATQLEEDSFRNHYRRSQGLCLQHLGKLVDAVQIADIRDFLLSHAATCFEEDAEDMRSYALKREALRRYLENLNEEDAYRRSVIRMVGERYVCAPWAEDREI